MGRVLDWNVPFAESFIVPHGTVNGTVNGAEAKNQIEMCHAKS
jgi:hypothetical protein